MKRSKFTGEQILAIVKEGEAGRTVADLSRTHGITEQRYYRWKAKFGGMELSEMQRLKQLEDENRRLKQIVAEQTLDIQALKAVVAKNGEPHRSARGSGVVGDARHECATRLSGRRAESCDVAVSAPPRSAEHDAARSLAGPRDGPASVRLSPPPHFAGARGPAGQPQTRPSCVTRGRPASAPAAAEATEARRADPAAGTERTDRTLVDGLHG